MEMLLKKSITRCKTTKYLNKRARTSNQFCAGFFRASKNFLTFFQFLEANHTFYSLYGAERGRNTFSSHSRKGGEII